MPDSVHSHPPAEQQANDLRFKQMMSYGIGAAIVFGIVGAVSKGLLETIGFGSAAGVTLSAASILPILGLVAIAAAGICAISYSANTLVRANALDQETQAEKNAEALHLKARSQFMNLHPAQGRPLATTFPETSEAPTNFENTALPEPTTRKWEETVRPANNNQPEKGAWQDRTANESEPNTSLTRA